MIVCIGPYLEKAMKNEVEHVLPQEFPLLTGILASPSRFLVCVCPALLLPSGKNFDVAQLLS